MNTNPRPIRVAIYIGALAAIVGLISYREQRRHVESGVLNQTRPTQHSPENGVQLHASSLSNAKKPQAMPLRSLPINFRPANPVGPKVIATLPNEVFEDGDRLRFRGASYELTAVAEGVTAEASIRGVGQDRVSLLLRLDSVTVGDQPLPLDSGAKAARGSSPRSIIYRRGSVDETYEMDAKNFEQSFVIRELPEGRGAITVSQIVDSNLVAPAENTIARRLAFTSGGREVFEISKAVVFDAGGRSLPLDLAYSQGRLTMTVPASWVEEATLPIVVDPLVSTGTVVSSGPGLSKIACNSDPNSGGYLVVSERQVANGADVDLVGQLLNAQGQLVGGQLSIAVGNGKNNVTPAISYAPAPVNKYLVAWVEYPSNQFPFEPALAGRVINADGTFATPILTLDSRSGAHISPAIAFDGANWYVVYQGSGILGRFVAPDGTPGIAADPDPGSSSFNPSVAFTGGVYAITWGKVTQLQQAVARIMSPDGIFATPVTVVDQLPNQQCNAAVVSPGPSGFLFAWEIFGPNSTTMWQGRFADTSLAFAGNAFDIATPTGEAFSPVSIAYSATDQQWAIFYAWAANSFLDTNNVVETTIGTTGVSSVPEQLTNVSTDAFPHGVAWNPNTNDIMLLYGFFNVSVGQYQLLVQRYSPEAPSAVLNGRWRFDEGTGVVAQDSSGSGNDGTLQNGVAWTVGKSGSAISLDGSSQYVFVPAVGMPAANAAQSISWWMNYASVPSGNQCVIGLTNDLAGSAVQCGFRDGLVTVWNYGGGILAQAQAPAPGTWHNFTYTFDGTTQRLYVNGMEANSRVLTNPQTAVPDKLEFGRWSGGSEYYSGLLDEVSIYGYALTATEVAELILDPTLKAYFKFNEGAGTTTADSSGNGHTGTLNSGVSWVAGRAGSAAAFTAGSSVSCVLGTGLPANNAPQTISWWMNTPSNAGVQAVVCLTNPSAGSAVQCGFRNDQVTVWNWGGNTLVAAAAPSLNTWHHYAYTYDGLSTHTLHINGVAVASSTATAQTGAPSGLDFGYTPGWAEHFLGRLDEVRIYGRVLSTAELAPLANSFRLEAYYKFDEGTGLSTVDSTGNGHDAVLSSASWASGRSETGILLNGTADYVTANVGSGLPANNANQTISWWMNVATNPSEVRTAFDLHNDTMSSSVQGGFRNSKVGIWNHGGNVLAESTPPAAGGWHHYAYTFDGTTHRLYIDGSLAGSSTALAQTAEVTSFVFGRWNGGPAEYFAGTLDEFRIYSRTLSATEVVVLAQDPTLAAHFRFDEGTGISAADSTGNGHDGTLSAGVTWISGAAGNAVSLTGASHIACAVRTGLPANNANQTISWWMNVATNPAGVQTAFDLHNDATSSSVQGGFRGGNVCIWNHGGGVLAQAPPPPAGAWHHYTYTFDGTTHRLYVDGLEAGNSTAAPQTAPVTSMVFGRWNGGPAEYFAGALDDVRIYTRALPAAEVQIHYQAARPPAPVIATPVSGGTVTQARPPVSGTSSEQGLLITLLVDGSAQGTTTSGAEGNWLIYPLTPMTDGFHTLTATASNGAGTSAVSVAVTITVDTVTNTQLTVSYATIQDEGFVNSAQPTYTVTLFNPQGSGINPASLVVRLDGIVIENPTITIIDANTVTISFTPSGTFTSQSSHTITVDGMTGTGGTLATVITAFSVDLSAPVISNVLPVDGAILNNRRPTVSATITDAGGSGLDVSGIVLVLNSVVVPANQVQVTLSNNNNTATLAFTPQSDLADATHVFSIEVNDRALNSETITSSYTVDTATPDIVIASPDGTPLSTPSTDLVATLTDSFTGVSPNSIQVTLNGIPVSVTKTLGSPTPFGAPGSVQVTGLLQPLQPSNLLVVSGSDLAGNTRSSTVAFTTSGSAPPIVLAAVELISGDGQSGLTGRLLSGDLVVRVYDLNTANPIAGVQVFFEEPAFRSGFMEPSLTGSTVSGSDGRAYARWVLSNIPGSNTVEARIGSAVESLSTAGSLTVAPGMDRVSFTLQGVSPTLEDVTVRGPSNICGFKTFEYPGSALSRLFTIQVKGQNGVPLAGVAMWPRISKWEGMDPPPPAVHVGNFMPTHAITDNEGKATFAFIIDKDIRASSPEQGTFTMDFTLPYFRNDLGMFISKKIDGKVLDPSNKYTPEIDFDSGDSGQEQIGVPNQRLALSLKTKGKPGMAGVNYRIIEGQGTFTPVDPLKDNGSYEDDCGVLRAIIFDQDLKAKIYFTMTGGTHALIAIDQVSDVFAIGPPQTSLVSQSNPVYNAPVLNGYGATLNTSGSTASLADAGFYLQVVVPSNFQGSITGKLKSLNRYGGDLEMLNPLGALTIENVTFSQVGGNERYAVYRSTGAPFAGIEGGVEEGTPTLPGGARFVQLAALGPVEGSVEITPLVQGNPGPKINTRTPPVYNAALATEVVYEDTGVFSAATPWPEPGSLLQEVRGLQFKGYEWKVHRPGSTGGDQPFYTPFLFHELYFEISETTQDTAAGKGKKSSPVSFQVPRRRRGIGIVTVDFVDANNSTWPNYKPQEVRWLVSSGPKVGPAIVLVGNAGQQTIDPANLNNGPAGLRFKALSDLGLFDVLRTPPPPLTPEEQNAKDQIKDWTGVVNPFTSGFLTSVSQSQSNNPNSKGLAQTMGFYLPVSPSQVTVREYGVVFFTPLCVPTLDTEDLESTLVHEVRHVEMGLALQGAPVPGRPQEQVDFATLENDLFSEVYKAAAGQNAATQRSYQRSAAELAITLEHLQIEFEMIRDYFSGADTTSSHWYLKLATNAFAKSYIQLMEALQFGYPVKNGNSLLFVPIATTSVRNRLIDQLRKLHRDLPEGAKRLRSTRPNEVPVTPGSPNHGGPPLSIPKKE